MACRPQEGDPQGELSWQASFLEALLPPCGLQRYCAWDKLRAENEGIGGSYLADIEHHPGRGSGGSLFPCLLTHGTVVDWEVGRPATSMEHVAAQGFHVFGDHKYNSRITSCLRSLQAYRVKRLAGNGICLPAILAWMVFVWSNTVKRLPPPLARNQFSRMVTFSGSLPVPEDDDDDDDIDIVE